MQGIPNILDSEANDIVLNGIPNNTKLKYNVYLHNEEDDIELDLLESVEILRDYLNNIGDYIVVRFQMYAGDFIYDLFKHRDNLQMTIVKDNGYTKEQERYKFVLLNNNITTTGSIYDKLDREELNRYEMVTVEGQCVPLLVDIMRQVNSDGIYRFVRPVDVIYSSIQKALNNITINCETPQCNIDVVDTKNNKIYNHIEIPTGINVMGVPTYLQNNKYGVYNGDIGTYIQTIYNEETQEYKPTIFIYPLYSKNRFKNVEKKLIIYKLEHNKFEFMDATHTKDGDIVKIVAGVESKGFDHGSNELVDEGHVIIANNSKSVVGSKQLVTDDVLITDKSTRLSATQFRDLNDKNQKHVYVGNDNNMFKHRSDILKKTMARFQIVWHFSDVELLYPGMPVMIVYNDSEYGILKLTGTLVSVFSRYNIGKKTESAILNIMVMKPSLYKKGVIDEE